MDRASNIDHDQDRNLVPERCCFLQRVDRVNRVSIVDISGRICFHAATATRRLNFSARNLTHTHDWAGVD